MRSEFERQLQNAETFFEVDTIEKTFQLLRDKKLTISFAESVTGGLLAARLTDIPGSSEVFAGGCVCYTNLAKVTMVGVDPKTLAAKGTVSRETAMEMAGGIRKRLNSDLGIGITGVAGPAEHGGRKPGTVFVGLADARSVKCKEFAFEGDRVAIRETAVRGAFLVLKYYLENETVS